MTSPVDEALKAERAMNEQQLRRAHGKLAHAERSTTALRAVCQRWQDLAVAVLGFSPIDGAAARNLIREKLAALAQENAGLQEEIRVLRAANSSLSQACVKPDAEPSLPAPTQEDIANLHKALAEAEVVNSRIRVLLEKFPPADLDYLRGAKAHAGSDADWGAYP